MSAAALDARPGWYPAEIAAPACTVAVTGCAGYLAGCIVERLLALGHTVHGTCRDLAKATELQAGGAGLWS